MAEHPIYKEGNEFKHGSSAVEPKSAFEPAQLNLRKMETIQRFFQYGAGLIFLVFLGLIAFSYLELRKIKKEINSRKQMLIDQKELIKQNQAKIKSQKDSINASFNKIAEMYQVIDTIRKTNPTIGKEILDKIENNISQNGDQKQILPRIYLHISREDQRSHAAAVGKQLQANGFIVPGIERVNPKSHSELRYFESTAITDNDVKKITSILKNISKVSFTSKPIQNTGRIRPRHYEIWFGEDFTSLTYVIKPDRR